MIAAARGQLPQLRTIMRLTMQCDLNARYHNEWTALHFAAYNGKGETVKVLLSQPGIITCPRTNRRAWMDDKEQGLTPYKLAQIGAQARAQESGRSNQKSARAGTTAIQVLDEFNTCRMAILLTLRSLARQLGVILPGDIAKSLVLAYRFEDTPNEQHDGAVIRTVDANKDDAQ